MASLISERLKSLADSENDLVKQESWLIKKEAPEIVRSLRTRFNHLQRREITVTLKNKKSRKTAAPKANVESLSRDFISDTSEASLEPIVNKSVAVASVLTQVTYQHASVFSALNLNTIAFNPSACNDVKLNLNNVPLSSDTNHVNSSDYNINNSASSTCLEAMIHATAKHSQTEAYKDQVKVFASRSLPK